MLLRRSRILYFSKCYVFYFYLRPAQNLYAIPHLIVILLFCLAKWWHQTATVAQLRFLLAPVDTVIYVVTGSSGVWRPDAGYFHADLNILVDASCAGLNFYLIAFLLVAYLLLRVRNRWWVVPLALLLAWPVAVVTNATRILTLLTVGEARWGISASVWHEGWGAFVYLTCLIIAGLAFHRLLVTYLIPSPSKTLS